MLKALHEADHVHRVVTRFLFGSFDCSLCRIFTALNVMPLVVKFDVVFVFAAKIAEEADLPELEPQLEDDASDFGVYFLLFK